jgi:hypothetical protein
LIIEFEGREWEYDEDAVSVQQAMAMHLAHGFTIKAWQQAIPELDPRAVQCCYWLMLQQNGVKKPLKDLDFAAVEFMSAYMKGLRADDAEDDEEPEPDPTPPSPPEDPPSTGPSTPTDTTRGRRHPVPPEPTGS